MCTVAWQALVYVRSVSTRKSSSIRILGLIFTAASVLFLAPCAAVHADQDICDPQLRSSDSDPLGYRLRGDRCEGRYTPNASASVVLLSLIEATDASAADKGRIEVSWHSASEESVSIQAQSVDPKKKAFYRMDVASPNGQGSYAWESGLLTSLGLSPKDLAIRASIAGTIDHASGRIFLPVVVRSEGLATHERTPGRITVLILPGAELEEVYVSLEKVTDESAPPESVSRQEPLKLGYYPQDFGISFMTPPLPSPGIYHLLLTAAEKSGGAGKLDFYFRY